MSVKLIESLGKLNFINSAEGGFSSIELDDGANAIVFTDFEGNKSAIIAGQTQYQNSGSAFIGTILTSALTANRQYNFPDAGGNVALESGANFGPAAPASITVVNGIITAIA